MIVTLLLIVGAAAVIFLSAHDSIVILTSFSKWRWRKKQEYRKTILHEMGSIAKMLWIAEIVLILVIAILSMILKISLFAASLYLVLAIAWTILLQIATIRHGNMPPDRPDVKKVRKKKATADKK